MEYVDKDNSKIVEETKKESLEKYLVSLYKDETGIKDINIKDILYTLCSSLVKEEVTNQLIFNNSEKMPK
jgi:hypothetical protein